MSTVEDLDRRIAKLEKRSPWRFVFQYLLAPLILIVFGFYFNWILQKTKSGIERIEIAHQIVVDALAGNYDESFVTLRLLPVVLDQALAEELANSIADYWAKRAEQELEGDRPEEAVAILRAAGNAGPEVAERVEAGLRASDVVIAQPDRLDRAHEADRLMAIAFNHLAEGRYTEAMDSFQGVEELYPTYGTAKEIGDLLVRNLQHMSDSATETRVLESIAEDYSREAPVGTAVELRRRVDR
ncbi:hypothetical protein KAW64_03595 [bacterium]|nr:hypothetical protein [bacterium]